MPTVKAAVLLAPGDLRIQEFPYPRLSGGDMLLRMEMAGICGTLALVLLTAVYMAHTSRPTVATRGFARSGLSKSARMCPGS